MLRPFMPNSMDKLLDLLAIEPNLRYLADIEKEKMEEGRALPAPQAIFPRYSDANHAD